MKSSILLLFILLNTSTILSQVRFHNDAEFSQVYDSPSNMLKDTGYIMGVSYQNVGSKDIGSNSYRRGQAQFYKSIRSGAHNHFSMGAEGTLGQSGEVKFTEEEYNLLSAYHLLLSKRSASSHYFSLGTRLSLQRADLRSEDLRWPSQIDPNVGFDPSKDSGEMVSANTFVSIDIGGTYSLVLHNGNYFKAGASIQDANTPNNSLVENGSSTLSLSIILYGLAQFSLRDGISLRPQIRYISVVENKLLHANILFAVNTTVGELVFGSGYSNKEYVNFNLRFLYSNSRCQLIYAKNIGTRALDLNTIEANVSFSF